ncbi:MAG: MBL fold metallo-hydrolase [Nocardioidaceae bacterium]
MARLNSSPFREVADQVFIARYPQWDVTVGAVIGTDGILLVDTRASAQQGRELLDDVCRLAPDLPIRFVVNTHQHFDHTFGNIAMPAATAIHAHANAAAGLDASAARIKRLVADDPEVDPAYPAITAEVLEDVVATQIRLPDQTFESVSTLDLGDRYVELVHPGRGHTDGDLVMRLPAVDVVFAGDLVEQSGPPGFGSDCWPLEWADSLDIVVGLLTQGSVVIPGHGEPVDKEFVQAQREDIVSVAQLIRSLHAQGTAVDQALQASTHWPFPAEGLAEGVVRGYQQLTAATPNRGAVDLPPGAQPLPLA